MIKFYIIGQTIRFASPAIAADSLNYLEAEFNFAEAAAWEGASKWAHFRQEREDEAATVYDINLDENDRITADKKLNLTQGEWEVYLTGTVGESRLTTIPVVLTVYESGLIDGPLHEMPLTVAEQIDIKSSRALTTAQTVMERADSGEFIGPAGATGRDGPVGPAGPQGSIGPPGPEGKRGSPGVHLGDEAPTDVDNVLWISEGEPYDPEGDAILQAYVTPTASGSIASFDDGADGLPVKSLVVDIEPLQAGGDPSPDNVLPISGWTGAKLQRTGKNLYDKEANPFGRYKDYTRVTWTPPFLLKRGTYTFKSTSNVGRCYVTFYLDYANAVADTNPLGQISFEYDVGYTYELSSDVYVRLQQNSLIEITDYTNISNSWQVELSSTATAYEPYQGDTYDISFPEMVYGAELDVTTGVLTVDRAMVDLGTLTWYRNASSGLFYADIPALKFSGPLLCSSYASSDSPSVENMGDKEIWAKYFAYTINNIVIKDTAYVDAYTFKASLDGVQAVYYLTTPLTYRLDPIEVKTLLGYNAISVDAGSVEVAYRADPTIIYSKIMNALKGVKTGG